MNLSRSLRFAPLSLAFALALPATAAETAHWGYAHGTEGWGLLAPAYAQCTNGLLQSPIDVIPGTAVAGNLPTLAFSYGTAVDFAMSHNGHTIVATPTTTGNTLKIGTKVYTLIQFHMHTPSENFANGEMYPLEYHFVHKASDGALAVVGVFYDDAPTANAQIGQLISKMPTPVAAQSLTGFNLRNFVPTGRSYRFSGSLTTPPCDEGVAWHVMGTVRTASASQIAAFQRIFSGPEFPAGNRRPVQSRNGRPLLTEW